MLGLDGAVARRLGARQARASRSSRWTNARLPGRVVRITSPDDPSRGASSQACPARVALFKAYALARRRRTRARADPAPIPPFRLLISDDDAAAFLGVDGAALHAVRDRSGAAVRVRDASDPADEKATTENPSLRPPTPPPPPRGRVVEVPRSPSLACSAAIRRSSRTSSPRGTETRARGVI